MGGGGDGGDRQDRRGSGDVAAAALHGGVGGGGERGAAGKMRGVGALVSVAFRVISSSIAAGCEPATTTGPTTAAPPAAAATGCWTLYWLSVSVPCSTWGPQGKAVP